MSSATATAAQILLVAQAFLLGLVVVQLQSRFVDRIRDRLDDLRVDALALEIDEWDERAARHVLRRAESIGSEAVPVWQRRPPPEVTPHLVFMGVSLILLVLMMTAEASARGLALIANPWDSAVHAGGYAVLGAEALIIGVQFAYIRGAKRSTRALVEGTVATDGAEPAVRYLLARGLLGRILEHYVVKIPDDWDELPEPGTALLEWSRADVRRAVVFAEAIVSATARCHGPHSQETMEARVQYGKALRGAGDVGAAEAELRSVYEDCLADAALNSVELSAAIELANVLVRDRREADGLEIAKEAVQTATHRHGLDASRTIEARAVQSHCLFRLARYDESLEIDEASLELRLRQLEPRHPRVLECQHVLAVTLSEIPARKEESRALTREVAENRRQVLGADHPDSLTSRSNVATDLRNGDDGDAALEIHIDVVTRRSRVLGDDHPDTLSARDEVSLDLWALERFDEGAGNDREVDQRRTRTLGADHPDTLWSRHSLGAALTQLGRYEEALPINEDVAERRTRILGPDHPDTLAIRRNLAITLTGLGRNQEAFAIDEDVYECRVRVLGVDHVDTMESRDNVATDLRNLDRYAEALAIEQDVADQRARVLGPAHRETLFSRANVASALRSLERYEEALVIDQEVAEGRAELLGPDHRETLIARNNVAADLRCLERYEEALALDEQVVARRAEFFGDRDDDTLWSRANVALDLRSLDRYVDALPIDRAVAEERAEVLGEDHPETLLSWYNTALDLIFLDEVADAVPILERVCDRRTDVLGPSHPETLTSLHVLAITYAGVGRHEESLRIHQDSAPSFEAAFGDDHPSTMECRNGAVTDLRILERFEEAVDASRELLDDCRRIYGTDGVTLKVLYTLVFSLLSLDRVQEALPLAEELVEVTTSLRPGVTPGDNLTARYLLVACLLHVERTDEGLALATSNVELASEVNGPRHPQTLAVRMQLASSLRLLERESEAEEIEQDVERLREELTSEAS